MTQEELDLWIEGCINHYKKNSIGISGQGKGNKDLWDFSSVSSVNKLSQIYSEMHFYDYINNYRKGIRTSQKYLLELLNLEYLLFYQNLNYFTLKSGGVYKNLNQKERELNHLDAILKHDPKNKIKKVKSIFTNNFYYIYCPYSNIEKQLVEEENKKLFLDYITPKDQLDRIERATKRALNTIGMHTTAKSVGDFLDMDIDFSAVQNEMVNLGGHSFNSGGKYGSLIISIRK